MTKSRVNIASLIIDLIIDFGLMAVGVVLYVHFMIYQLAPIDINQMFVDIVGSKLVAVLILAGLPFLVGLYNLIRTLIRTGRKLSGSPPQKTAP
jgi:hypothetical protein